VYITQYLKIYRKPLGHNLFKEKKELDYVVKDTLSQTTQNKMINPNFIPTKLVQFTMNLKDFAELELARKYAGSTRASFIKNCIMPQVRLLNKEINRE